MKSVFSKQRAQPAVSVFLTLLLAFLPLAHGVTANAQTISAPGAPQIPNETEEQGFRLKRTPVAGGAELLTVFGALHGHSSVSTDAAATGPATNSTASEVPLISILRDTLGDTNQENDRLRYVWMLTYTRPTLKQRVASAIPFLYRRAGNKRRADKDVPPPVIDLAAPAQEVWDNFFWLALQNILIDPYGFTFKTATRAYRRNAADFRKAHIFRALAVLSLYEAEAGVESVFSPSEMREIQARLMLTEKALGGIIDDGYLQSVYQKSTAQWNDMRGHNWELLRQRAEAESLYFEPLQMPDGNPTHALLWVARADLTTNRGRPFSGRFLNIASPWRDKRLAEWEGYTETRYFDAENRPAAPGAAGGRAVEMIPLALYGLDYPKIPTLLVDFRDGMNPKKREMSRRVLEDVARNLLALSRYGDLHYFLGRSVYDLVTGRRGIDVNQPTRLRSYSQLKLLLSLSASLDPHLRAEISRRLERISLNPLENDLYTEARLARDQYQALLDYANRPDGLQVKLERDRRAELTSSAHGRAERILFRFANIMSFGRYRHREDARPDVLRERLDRERRMAYHRRFLREASKSSPLVEVVWDIEEIRRSLRFILENDRRDDSTTARAAARIFMRTADDETRRLCLNCLYHINNRTARNELLRISNDPSQEPEMRAISTGYLRRMPPERERVAPSVPATATVSEVMP